MNKHLIYAITGTLLLASQSLNAGTYIQCIATNTSTNVTIPVQFYPSKSTPHIVYCGDSFVYVSRYNAAVLDEQLRMGRNMVLKINNEYIDSPCF